MLQPLNSQSNMRTDTLLSKSEVPIIDLTHLVAGTDEEAPVKSKSGVRRVAAQLHKALAGKGLALLVNHGISDDKLKLAFSALDQFCDQPKDVHDKYMRTRPHNHGYVPPGVERFSEDHVKEIRHTFNVSWLDRMLPDAEVPGFREAVTSLAQDFRRVSTFILEALAVALDLPSDYFLESHQHIFQEGNETCMRLLYYPPFGTPPRPGETRCGEHADYGTFTLLAQDCEGGLEILNEHKKWARVGHLPGALLLNTGELLASWTSGKYPALRHRVVVPDQSILRNKGRHCIAFFVHPNDDTLIEPIANARTSKEKTEEDPTETNGNKTNSKPQEKQNTIYTAYQHLQMRFRQTYVS